jgi:hypothetical protein
MKFQEAESAEGAGFQEGRKALLGTWLDLLKESLRCFRTELAMVDRESEKGF